MLILFILLFYQIQSGCLSVLASFICGKGKYSDKMESKAITGKNTHKHFPCFKNLPALIAMTKQSIIIFSLEWYCNLLEAVK